jgi:hypothetical protein
MRCTERALPVKPVGTPLWLTILLRCRNMPLTADPQANVKEILRASRLRPSSRFYKARRTMRPDEFRRYVLGAAYHAARAKGYT